MKKTPTSMSSSSGGLSPTKVQDFPLVVARKKKSVRFQFPLEEHQNKVNESMMSHDHNNSVLLDTSAEILDTVEYFCKCDSFLDAFEQNAYWVCIAADNNIVLL